MVASVGRRSVGRRSVVGRSCFWRRSVVGRGGRKGVGRSFWRGKWFDYMQESKAKKGAEMRNAVRFHAVTAYT